MFIARYEKLRERPFEVLTALCIIFGLRIKPSALSAVIAQGSEEGTEFSRARQVEPGSDLTDQRQAAFRDCRAKLAPSA